MGRGSSGSTSRYGGGGDLNPSDILSTELMTWSGTRASAEDDFFKTAETLYKEYGNDAVPQDFFQIAELKPGASRKVIAYYDGANVALNKKYMDSATLDSVYDKCIADGFHPGRGNKSGAEAVAAHELGHRLTDAVAQKMGIAGIDANHAAATKIVNEARSSTGAKGVVQMAAKISRYATASNAEAVAEAVSDVFCNGSKATKESRAIVGVIDSYLKGK